jgi:hypothetical protein
VLDSRAAGQGVRPVVAVARLEEVGEMILPGEVLPVEVVLALVIGTLYKGDWCRRYFDDIPSVPFGAGQDNRRNVFLFVAVEGLIRFFFFSPSYPYSEPRLGRTIRLRGTLFTTHRSCFKEFPGLCSSYESVLYC